MLARSKLVNADHSLIDLLKPVSQHKFIVLHDALQYFEQHFKLHSHASLTIDSHKASSAKRLTQLKTAIKTEGIQCLLYEQIPDETIVDVLLEGLNARAAIIDPPGMSMAGGEMTYSYLLLKLAHVIGDCLLETKE